MSKTCPTCGACLPLVDSSKKKKTFYEALAEAREALTHMGTGELRDK